MATLAEKIYAVILGEETPEQIAYQVKEMPQEARGDKELDELDLHEWFIAFGIGYALSRAEEPFGSEEQWQAAAKAAATEACRWVRTVGGKPEPEEVA